MAFWRGALLAGLVGLTLVTVGSPGPRAATDGPGVDGAGPIVTVNLGFGRALMTVTLSESDAKTATSDPFDVDPAAMTFQLADGRGTTVTLAPLEVAPVTAAPGRAVLTYRMPQDLPAGVYALSYRGPRSLHTASGAAAALTDIMEQTVYFPNDDEAEFQAIRTRLIGKRVYGYPNVAIDCPGSEGQQQNRVAAVDSARVVDIVRYAHLTLPVYYNTRPTSGRVANSPEFIAVNPIIVTYDNLEPGDALPGHQRAGTAPCSETIRVFADTWQIDRELTLRPASDHAEWPVAMLAAIAAGRPAIGMTPEMVAYAWGFPPQLGSVTDLEQLGVWKYGDEPGDPQVRFEDGRVVEVRTQAP